MAAPYGSAVTSLPENHVLVVEDEPEARETLCELLIDAGYLPVAVGDGVEALEHLRSGHRPSLIILDLLLPRIDGWRFLTIRSETEELEKIPVVVCSGASDRPSPPGVPSDHVLGKPVDPDLLLAFAAKYCGDNDPWERILEETTRAPRAGARKGKPKRRRTARSPSETKP